MVRLLAIMVALLSFAVAYAGLQAAGLALR
jgi:hypothetical protein